MKLLNVLAVFAFIAMAKGAVTECNSCLEENTANCTTRGVMFSCSNDTFPNVGTTHCYTAAYYMGDNMTKPGVARGCGNCSANNSLTDAAFKKFIEKLDEKQNVIFIQNSFNVMCCASGNNCNNQTVSPMSPATTVTTSTSVGPTTGGTGGTTKPSSHATRLFPISGIVAFVAIFLAVTL